MVTTHNIYVVLVAKPFKFNNILFWKLPFLIFSILDATLKARIKRFIIEQRIKLEDLNAIHQRYESQNDYCIDND